MVIKVQHSHNYNFNYTAQIDQEQFNRIKQDQSLEIEFEELHSQIIEMLKNPQEQNACINLIVGESNCKLVFYEKSRLKSLILLTIELHLTKQSEIIDEIAAHLHISKEQSSALKLQLNSSQNQLAEARNALKASKSCQEAKELYFREQIATISRKFVQFYDVAKDNITAPLGQFDRRLLKLQRDLETVKSESKLKYESNVRLVASLRALQLENERHMKIIDDYKLEVNHLRLLKFNSDEEMESLRRKLQNKQREEDEHIQQIIVLRKDLQEATLIIAEKSESNAELNKDVSKANSVICDFRNKYNDSSKQCDELQFSFGKQTEFIADLEAKMKSLEQRFEEYRLAYGSEKMQMLESELIVTKQMQEELEKKNKGLVKVNTLLARKVSSYDARFDGFESGDTLSLNF